MDPDTTGATAVRSEPQHVDRIVDVGSLGAVKHPPNLRSGEPCDERVPAEMKCCGHSPAQLGRLRAAYQKDAGKAGVQPAGADLACQGVLADARGAELVQVNVAVLQFGETGDLGVATTSDQLELTKRPT
jgi:hypothetical protein